MCWALVIGCVQQFNTVNERYWQCAVVFEQSVIRFVTVSKLFSHSYSNVLPLCSCLIWFWLKACSARFATGRTCFIYITRSVQSDKASYTFNVMSCWLHSLLNCHVSFLFCSISCQCFCYSLFHYTFSDDDKLTVCSMCHCAGERNLYALSEVGQLLFMKKFDFNPLCFLPYSGMLLTCYAHLSVAKQILMWTEDCWCCNVDVLIPYLLPHACTGSVE